MVAWGLLRLLTPSQWNLLIYLGLFILLSWSIIQEILEVNKTQKGTFTDGYYVDKSDENKEPEVSIIEFISPFDRKKYRIQVNEETHIPWLIKKQKLVRIWVNGHNPEKSLVARKMDSVTILSITSKAFFAIIFLVLSGMQFYG